MYTRAASNGKWGEIYAARMLNEKGDYYLIDCDYRVRGGEIDLIAIHKEFLVCAEVKTRGRGAIGEPREWVTEAKRRRLITAAKLFLAETGRRLQPRFDVIEVWIDDSALPPKLLKINHIENAFNCEDEIF